MHYKIKKVDKECVLHYELVLNPFITNLPFTMWINNVYSLTIGSYNGASIIYRINSNLRWLRIYKLLFSTGFARKNSKASPIKSAVANVTSRGKRYQLSCWRICGSTAIAAAGAK